MNEKVYIMTQLHSEMGEQVILNFAFMIDFCAMRPACR